MEICLFFIQIPPLAKNLFELIELIALGFEVLG